MGVADDVLDGDVNPSYPRAGLRTHASTDLRPHRVSQRVDRRTERDHEPQAQPHAAAVAGINHDPERAGQHHPGTVTTADGAAILAAIVRTFLPLIERIGVATAAEVGADTFEQRLSDELATAATVFAHPALMSASGTACQAT